MDPEVPQTTKNLLTCHLLLAITAAGIGSSFQHGYNTGVLNNPLEIIGNFTKDVIKSRNPNDAKPVSDDTIDFLTKLIASIFCFGGIIGGCLIGIVTIKFGRKGSLLLNNVLVFISAAFLGFSKLAKSFEMIILGRLLIGINCGLNAGISPMYLSEISPVQLRGAVSTVYQLVLTLSILISQILGLTYVMGTVNLWPWLLAFTAVPGVFQVITLLFSPESPKHILSKNSQEEKAQKALVWFRGTTEVQEELNEIKAENDQIKLEPKVTIKEMLTKSSLRMPLIISVVIMLAQQFSGINAAMFYSTQIFSTAKLGDKSEIATLSMGTVNFLMTVVSILLVEKYGRKFLLLLGFGGMFIVTLMLVVGLALVEDHKWISYCCVVLVNLFVIAFAIGPGPIPWFIVNELFNQSARSTASSIAVPINWTANFFVTIGFGPLQKKMGKGYVFIIFAVCQALSFIFIYFFVPETKQKPISEIIALFEHPQAKNNPLPETSIEEKED